MPYDWQADINKPVSIRGDYDSKDASDKGIEDVYDRDKYVLVRKDRLEELEELEELESLAESSLIAGAIASRSNNYRDPYAFLYSTSNDNFSIACDAIAGFLSIIFIVFLIWFLFFYLP